MPRVPNETGHLRAACNKSIQPKSMKIWEWHKAIMGILNAKILVPNPLLDEAA